MRTRTAPVKLFRKKLSKIILLESSPKNVEFQTGAAGVAQTAGPAQLPREHVEAWPPGARPIDAMHMRPRPPLVMGICGCLVATRPPRTRLLLRAAPRQRDWIFIIFSPSRATGSLGDWRLHGPPNRMKPPSRAVCWPGTIGASTNTRSCHAFLSVWRPMLAPGAIAHARGGKWQDFGRSRARSREAGCP